MDTNSKTTSAAPSPSPSLSTGVAPAQNFVRAYGQPEPGREAVDALPGATLLEFGAPWCGICAGAQPLIAAALAAHPQVRHIKVEDGRGRRLGRSFGVKLWPTLVFLRDGQEAARLVRPARREAIDDALQALA